MLLYIYFSYSTIIYNIIINWKYHLLLKNFNQDIFSTVQLKEESAAAIAEKEAALEEAWWKLASVAQDHEDQTKIIRNDCEKLQGRVNKLTSTLNKVNQNLQDMKVNTLKNIYLKLHD